MADLMVETFFASAPFRIGLAGGFTDLFEYYSRFGGSVISASINCSVNIAVHVRNDKKIIIHNKKSNVPLNANIDNTKTLGIFYESIIKNLDIKQGFELDIDIPMTYGSGLGSSSANIVAIIGALQNLIGFKLNRNEIAELAYKIESEDMQVHLGKQDAYAAVYGGFNLINFSDTIKVEPLSLSKTKLKELEDSMLFVEAGFRSKNENSINDIKNNIRKNDQNTINCLNNMRDIAREMRQILNDSSIQQIGHLLMEEWKNKRLLSSMMSNEKIERIFEIANMNKVFGYKLLGGGNGGHVLIMADRDNLYNINQQLIKSGYITKRFAFANKGLEVSKIPQTE
jgi:D-glycero-alpha-D-manno-heptose-7-phosphate kinase